MLKSKNVFRFSLFGGILLFFFASGCGKSGGHPKIAATDLTKAQFVGDEACVDCHEDLYASYKKTGMGRSVVLFEPQNAPEKFGQGPVFDQKSNFFYEAFVRNDTLYQREFRKDAQGHVTHEQIHRADYVVGSGNATRSYLMNVNGYVTEMPLTWYVARQKWDMSPGYTQRNDRFDRPVNLECMTCHNGFPTFTEGTQNHFTKVPLGIGCERCHGPGSIHVDARLAEPEYPKDKPDPTVINPKRLSRENQLSVCQQCHVDGTQVFEPNQTPLTYRPNMVLATHRTIYTPKEVLQDPEHFGIASHGSRLAQSACYQKTNMTCSTCHDPHKPFQELGADYLNQKCQACHQTGQVCSRSEAHGNAQQAMQGNCISCHMQQSGTRDIPHVTFTDHWIRRKIPAAKAATSVTDMDAAFRRENTFQLVSIQNKAVVDTQPPNTPQAKLMAAVAYFRFYDVKHRIKGYLPIVTQYAEEGFAGGGKLPEARIALGRAYLDLAQYPNAIRNLEQAVQENPNDTVTRYWLGYAYEKSGATAKAIEVYREAVRRQPLLLEASITLAQLLMQSGETNEAVTLLDQVVQRNPLNYPNAWYNLGVIYLQRQDPEKARSYLQKAVSLNPDHADAMLNLAGTYLMRQQFNEAQTWLERAIAQQPKLVGAYGNLGLIYLQKGDKTKAKAMFQKVLALNPGDTRAAQFLRNIP